MNRRSKAMRDGIQTGDMPEAIPGPGTKDIETRFLVVLCSCGCPVAGPSERARVSQASRAR